MYLFFTKSKIVLKFYSNDYSGKSQIFPGDKNILFILLDVMCPWKDLITMANIFLNLIHFKMLVEIGCQIIYFYTIFTPNGISKPLDLKL